MTKKDRWLLFIMVAGLSGMLILRDINGISISKFIYFGFAVACMAIVNYQALLDMICFILPLMCGLPGTYIMPCAVALLLLKGNKVKPVQVIPVLIILVMEMFAALWYPSFQLAAIVQYVSFAGIMVFLIHDDTEIDALQCIKMYVCGLLLLCAVILVSTLMDAPSNWMRLFAAGKFRFGDVHAGGLAMQLSLNANSLAYYSLTGITCGALLMEKAKGKNKLWYIIFIMFFAVTGFLTVSRSWLLVLGICLLLYVISKLHKPKHFLILLLVLVAIFVAVRYYFKQNPEMLASFTSRFDDVTEDGGGGRTQIFKKYMQIYLDDIRLMLFGTGVTQYNEVAGTAGAIHNGTQQILVSCGLGGFIFYMIVFITAVLKAKRSEKIPMVYWLPLISVVAFVQTIQFLNPMMLMLPFIIGIYALKAGAAGNTLATGTEKAVCRSKCDGKEK